MPDMDGLTLTRRLKSDPATAGIVIVAFTAHAMKGDEQRMREAGCDGYIAKPIDVAGFAAQVRALAMAGGQ
jgi:two-component system cell cycle response regulator DivK